MKKKTESPGATSRVVFGMLLLIGGAALAVLSVDQFPAQAKRQSPAANTVNMALIPPGFDCAQIHALGIDQQENLRASAMMIYCGEALGGSPDGDDDDGAPAASFGEKLLQPLLGGADKDLVTGTETFPHVTQSETFAAANPDNPNEIVVAYNDSRGVNANPIDISSVSVSEDGGNTFTRVTTSNNLSPFPKTLGDPVALYNRPTATWFTIWLDQGSGTQGIGGYKSTNPSDPNSWTHFTVHSGSSDDRESGWADNNPSSPFYGHMYVSFNDFARGGGALFVRFSTDNGATWNERQVTTSFMRDVQITGDPTTGTVYLASMNEMGGGLSNRQNLLFRSTDGGNTWTNTYTGPTFAAPGVTTCPNTFFACMFKTGSQGYWRHQGWGQPAAFNGVVSYVYDARNTATGDPADVFYIRSTDGGVTFSAPMQLNTDTTTRPNWQPNISVAADGSLLAVWYDTRSTSSCTKGSPTVPCYQMWGRKSLDNGATWQPDQPFSDVISPLPGQPDSGIVTEYAGDYDYSNSVGNQHIHAWTDGRVTISNQSQQDTFSDLEPATGGGDTITLTAQHKAKRGVDIVRLSWSGASASQVDIYRNGALLTTTANSGSFTDTPGAGTFTYHVCDAGTSTCSNDVTVKFRN